MTSAKNRIVTVNYLRGLKGWKILSKKQMKKLGVI